MSLIIPLSVSLLSFVLGLGVVVFVANQRGYLRPALEILQNQQVNQANVRALEMELSEREREIARLKQRLKEFQDQVARQAAQETSISEVEEDVFELDAHLIETQPKAPARQPAPVSATNNSHLKVVSDSVEKDKDVASLSDMNVRLQQISLLMKSLPSKFQDVLRSAVTAREDKVAKLQQSIDAISKLSTMNQDYIDSVLTNASSKSEELEIKGVILKMRSSRAAMFRVKTFVTENEMSHFHTDVVDEFRSLVVPHTAA